MNKRFIAIISLVVVLVAVILTVVIVDNKKEIYVDKDGVEHWVYVDDYGHTALNEYGEVLVYMTDANGRRQKDENGEYLMGGVEFPSQIIDGNTFETPDYRITMPKEWELQEDGVFRHKKNEDIQLRISKTGIREAEYIDDYMEEYGELYKDVIEIVEKMSLRDDTITYGGCTITKKNIDCRTVEYKIAQEDKEKIDTYIMEIYYVQEGKVFKIEFRCENGSYDTIITTEQILDLLNSNFATKLYK